MNVRKIIITIGLLLTAVLISCTNFLGQKSDSKLLVPKSLSDIQGILDDGDQMNVGKTPSFGEASADDIFIPPVNLNAYSEMARDIYVWKKVDYKYPNDWSNAYLPIYNSNFCLELLEQVPRNQGNAKLYDNAKGSALFFRSFYFYLLTMQFGKAYNADRSLNDLGIVLRMTSDFNVGSVRSPVSQCLQQALSDAMEAASLLPETPETVLRPSKAAAYAQLSRIYMYMRDYSTALNYADECLKIKSELMDYNSDNDVLGLDLPVTFRKFNKETIFYAEMGSGFGMHVPSVARIDTSLYASYNVNDLRRRAFFKANGIYQQFKGSYSSSAATLFSGIATDEVYLNRSECKANMGDLGGAMADLNFLLKKRWKSGTTYLPLTSVDKTDALQKIRMERRKELLMRNLRWPDLKRFNEEGSEIILQRSIGGVKYYLLPNVSYYALPLPTDIIEQAGIPQN